MLSSFSNETMRQWSNSIKEYIFPCFCLGCKKEGSLVCTDCQKTIMADPVVEEKNGYRLLTGAVYKEKELLAQLIEAGKYHFVEDAFKYCVPLIEKVVQKQQAFFEGIDVICPIPLHRRRFAERGFNQAHVIATLLSKTTDIPVVPLLTRTKATRQQARLTRAERLNNVSGAFSVRSKVLRGTVLVVDDVYTTGSTMDQAIRAVYTGGATAMKGFTIARG